MLEAPPLGWVLIGGFQPFKHAARAIGVCLPMRGFANSFVEPLRTCEISLSLDLTQSQKANVM